MPSYGGPGYGMPWPTVRHRPGIGLAVGIAGLLLLVLSLTALPWISVGGEDATVGDLRDAYEALDDLGGGDLFGTTEITAPEVSVPEVSVPDPSGGGLGPVVTPPPIGSSDPYVPPSGGGTEPWHELYVKALCWVLAFWAALGLVGAAGWVPPTKSGRMMVGFFVAGLLGLGVNAADERGRVGPRVVGAAIALVGLVAHAAAVQGIFGQEGAPDPAVGAWAGGLGLVLVLVGCIVGTRTDEAPAAW